MRIGTFGAAAALPLILLGAGAASAADLSYPSPPTVTPIYSPVSAYDWTGFYVGVNAGYGWGTAPGCTTSTCQNRKPTGGIAGVQAGFNWQYNASWVFGLEADYDWSGMKHTAPITSIPSENLTQSIDGIGTFRGRIGYVIAPRTLIYGTAGLAFGSGTRTNEYHDQSVSKSHVGWAAGAGIEHAFTDHISGKIEAIYTDLGTQAYGPLIHQASAANVHLSSAVVRVGLNFKF